MAEPGMSYREFAKRLVAVSKEKSEWSGMPLPIEGQRLILADKHPYKQLEHFQFGTSLHVDTSETINEAPDYEVNSFWCCSKGSDLVVIRKANGRTTYGIRHHNRAAMLLDTIGASFAWPLEAEQKAQAKLKALIGEHKMTLYLLTGMFLETSPRSKVTYMFRKSRPTLALKESKGQMRILCALCLHAVGYYAGTFAGVMVPTDEIIAHLALMRGDEPKFWARANQHAAYRPEAGL